MSKQVKYDLILTSKICKLYSEKNVFFSSCMPIKMINLQQAIFLLKCRYCFLKKIVSLSQFWNGSNLNYLTSFFSYFKIILLISKLRLKAQIPKIPQVLRDLSQMFLECASVISKSLICLWVTVFDGLQFNLLQFKQGRVNCLTHVSPFETSI